MIMVPPQVKQIGEDIRTMKIRGAGRIARAACEALIITVKHSNASSSEGFFDEVNA